MRIEPKAFKPFPTSTAFLIPHFSKTEQERKKKKIKTIIKIIDNRFSCIVVKEKYSLVESSIEEKVTHSAALEKLKIENEISANHRFGSSMLIVLNSMETI